MTKPLPGLDPTELDKPIHDRQTMIDRDRRRQRRVPVALETAVPVLVRTDHGTQRGLVRNISSGGALIEVPCPPGIGSTMEIFIQGIPGTVTAPENVAFWAEVRHQMHWNFTEEKKKKKLHAVGVRFIAPPEPTVPPGSSIH
jgi:hypothetical protein